MRVGRQSVGPYFLIITVSIEMHLFCERFNRQGAIVLFFQLGPTLRSCRPLLIPSSVFPTV